MAVPAVPGAGFVVIEPKLGFCGLETVLDGPAMAFDADQRGGIGSGRTPSGKESEVAIGDMAADQKPPRPNTPDRVSSYSAASRSASSQ